MNLLQKENNKPSVCWRRNLTPTAYEQQAAIKNTQSSGSLSSGNRNSHIECQPRHNDGNVNIIKPKDGESSSRVYLLPKHMQNERKHVQNARLEKDAKSFVQNLFDTVALKTLHIARIPEGYLQWVPWLQVPNDNLLSSESDCKFEFMAIRV